mmetsp:Transcript_16925/g.45287  ORF Transcript_16925/g.45287 Transcript_16925/m.45287 type:complete len:340 (-) Transcript_16925:34-1053(-)
MPAGRRVRRQVPRLAGRRPRRRGEAAAGGSDPRGPEGARLRRAGGPAAGGGGGAAGGGGRAVPGPEARGADGPAPSRRQEAADTALQSSVDQRLAHHARASAGDCRQIRAEQPCWRPHAGRAAGRHGAVADVGRGPGLVPLGGGAAEARQAVRRPRPGMQQRGQRGPDGPMAGARHGDQDAGRFPVPEVPPRHQLAWALGAADGAGGAHPAGGQQRPARVRAGVAPAGRAQLRGRREPAPGLRRPLRLLRGAPRHGEPHRARPLRHVLRVRDPRHVRGLRGGPLRPAGRRPHVRLPRRRGSGAARLGRSAALSSPAARCDAQSPPTLPSLSYRCWRSPC